MEAEAHQEEWLWTYGYDYLAACWLKGPCRLDPQVLEQWAVPMKRENSPLSDALSQVVRMLEDPVVQTGAEETFRSGIALPIPGRHVPPYASMFCDSPAQLWGVTTEQVAQWYGAMELEWAGLTAAYPLVRAPDHLGLEWAFAAELIARSPEVAENRGTLRQQFVGHLNQWVPRYVTQLGAQTHDPYWEALGDWAVRWIRCDMKRLMALTGPLS